MKKQLLGCMFFLLAHLIVNNSSAQWTTKSAQSFDNSCASQDYVDDHYRIGILNQGTWGGTDYEDQYIYLGPGDLGEVVGGTTAIAPVSHRFYGITSSMNSDRLFVGLKLKEEVTGCGTNYSSENNTDALIAWGNDDGNDPGLSADRLIFEFHHYDTGIPEREIATMLPTGNVGIATASPTARLHVDCIDGNTEPGLSDIRFENLEQGPGNILVIDDQGYVFNSLVYLNEDGTIQGSDSRVAQLINEIEQLKARLDKLTNDSKATQVKSSFIDDASNSNTLFQNVPNPFGTETVIEYNVQNIKRNAYIMVYDLNGHEVSRYPVAQGKGKVSVDGSNLVSGVYMYSLIVDGYEIDSKRMVLAK